MLFLIASCRFFSFFFKKKSLDNIFYRKSTNSGNFTIPNIDINMKRSFFSILILSLLFIACDNNNKPKNSISDVGKDGIEQVPSDSNKIKDAVQDMQQLKEELSKLTPLTNDDMKAKLPEQLMGAPASGAEVNAAVGTTVASADYKMNDSTDLKLEIVDCAGPGGSGLFGVQYLNMINTNSDNEEEYIKTIDLNGGKALESCMKNRNRCTIGYFSGNRFLVSLMGNNVGIDALKDLAKELNIK